MAHGKPLISLLDYQNYDSKVIPRGVRVRLIKLFVRVTEAVKADRDLVNSNAGRHWLAQFENLGPRAIALPGLFTIVGCFRVAPGSFQHHRATIGRATRCSC